MDNAFLQNANKGIIQICDGIMSHLEPKIHIYNGKGRTSRL